MKKHIIIASIALVLSILSLATVIYAWFTNTINRQNIIMNTSLLDMDVTLFKGKDWNRDGELDTFYNEETEAYEDDFEEIIEDEENPEELIVSEQNLFPGDVVTYKLHIKNTGASKGLLSIRLTGFEGKLREVMVTEMIINEDGDTALTRLDGDELIFDAIKPCELSRNNEEEFIIRLRFAHLNELKIIDNDFFASVSHLNAYQNESFSFKFIIILQQI